MCMIDESLNMIQSGRLTAAGFGVLQSVPLGAVQTDNHTRAHWALVRKFDHGLGLLRSGAP